MNQILPARSSEAVPSLDYYRDQLAMILDPERESPARTAFYQAFFPRIKKLFRSVDQRQVDGVKRLLWLWEFFPQLKSQRPEYLYACLAYIYLETGARMRPVRETNASSDERAVAILDKWWASGRARSAGVRSEYWHATPQHPFGRGDIQTTHHAGYKKGRAMLRDRFELAVPLDNDYSLALDPIVSGLLAFGGCLYGIYTGKGLPDYWNGSRFDYYNSRDIVNGDKKRVSYDMDRDGKKERIGEEIAGIAEHFRAAIEAGNHAAERVGESEAPEVITAPPVDGSKITPQDLSAMETPELATVVAQGAALVSAGTSILEQRANQAAAPFVPAEILELQPPIKSTPADVPGKENAMSITKSFVKSKTIGGIATMVIGSWLPTLLPMFGYSFSGADAQTAVSAISAVMEAAGALFAVYGRVVAKEPLSLS